MSALPKNVRAQVERANKLAKEFQDTLNPAPDAAAPTAIVAPFTGDTVTPSSDTPAADAAATTPAQTPASVTPLPDTGWEQKYKVLQGKYNAEVPRLQKANNEHSEQIRNLQQQLTATQNLLASLGSQRASAPAPSQATPPAPVRLVKDEEVREFGPDLIDVVRRVAREEHASLLPEIDRRVAPVAQRVSQTAQAVEQATVRQAQSDRQTVIAQLAAEVPNYLDVNADAAFLQWLDQRDPYAGRPRGELLSEAFEAHDGPRVVAFFKGFLNENAVVTPPATTTPAAAAPAPQRKLEQLVTPGTPKAGAASAQDGSGKRVWTRAEISDFYGGRMKFKDAQHKKDVERDIFAAQREGRIR